MTDGCMKLLLKVCSFCSWYAHFCSGNPCLCGGVPGWLMPFLVLSPAGLPNGTNSTSSTGTIMQPCGPEADFVCSQSLWTPDFLRDTRQLLLLKAAAANNKTAEQLGSWRGSVPPCTNSSANASCTVCDDSAPGDSCGSIRAGDGAQLCNWRYVQCRDGRVVSINLANKVSCCTLCSQRPWGGSAQRGSTGCCQQ